MSIEKCVENELGIKLVGVAGILGNGSYRTYQSSSGASYFCPPDKAIEELIRGGITYDSQKRLREAMYKQMQRFKQQQLWMNIVTVATPALEVLLPEQLSTLALETLSLNELIAEHCVNRKIKRPALLGSEWDTAPDSPLVRTLAEHGIEAQVPKDKHMCQMMTCCVLSEMRNPIIYRRLSKEANIFCVDVVNSMLHESVGTLDAFIICNPELRSFRLHLHQHLKGDKAIIPIIDATELHWAAIAARTSKKPPS